LRSRKKGYELYNRKTSRQISSEVAKEIVSLKDQILLLRSTKKRIDFKQPSSSSSLCEKGHRVNITPYWLLGFVEAEGSFSVATKGHWLDFSIGQTASELNVLKAIQVFILNLPGSYKMTRSDTNPVGLNLDNKAKNDNTS